MFPNNRIIWADTLKGFLSVLVVLGHAIQFSVPDYTCSHLFNYIYSFHIPLFMAMSGFVSYKPQEQSPMGRSLGGAKKFSAQLLTPYLFWSLLLCTVRRMDLVESLFVSPIYWFLIVLFFIRLLIIGCQWISNALNLNISYVYLFVLCTLFVQHALYNISLLSLNLLPFYFTFYMVGRIIRRYESRILREWIIILLFVCFLFLSYYYQQNSSPSFLPSLPASLYFFTTGLCGTFLFMAIFKFVIGKYLTGLTSLGTITLGVYVSNIFFSFLLSDSIQKCYYRLGSFWGITFICVVMLFSSVLITRVLKKNKYTKYLV